MSIIAIPYVFANNTVADATEVNSNFSTIYSDYNGGILNANISAFAAIDDSKLAQITTAGKVAESAISNYPFKTGDWVLSTVDTARTGWTNVSATYSNKFMRINATPLTTGGADTHVHAGPSHTHSVPALSISAPSQASGGSGPYCFAASSASTGTGTTGAEGTGNTGSADNIPAYVQVVIFQKD